MFPGPIENQSTKPRRKVTGHYPAITDINGRLKVRVDSMEMRDVVMFVAVEDDPNVVKTANLRHAPDARSSSIQRPRRAHP